MICLPRAIYRPAPWDGVVDPHEPHDKRATRIDTDPVLLGQAGIFEKLLLAIAERIPVIVAAGNNGFRHRTVYPASLPEDANGIISVGAINSRQQLSSYTNTENVTVFAPSDDALVWTRDELRLGQKAGPRTTMLCQKSLVIPRGGFFRPMFPVHSVPKMVV